MSLVCIKNVAQDISIGLWRIEESVDDFILYNPSLKRILPLISSFQSSVRKQEKMATYSLLFAMTGNDMLDITHNTDGKPIVKGYYISVSHTRGYAAIILSKSEEVAIDIEYVSSRVERIADRFVRNDENAPTVSHQLVLWSAKETMYKYFSAQNLQFFDMAASRFSIEQNGELKMTNLKTGVVKNVTYLLNESFVMTYII